MIFFSQCIEDFFKFLISGVQYWFATLKKKIVAKIFKHRFSKNKEAKIEDYSRLNNGETNNKSNKARESMKPIRGENGLEMSTSQTSVSGLSHEDFVLRKEISNGHGESNGLAVTSFEETNFLTVKNKNDTQTEMTNGHAKTNGWYSLELKEKNIYKSDSKSDTVITSDKHHRKDLCEFKKVLIYSHLMDSDKNISMQDYDSNLCSSDQNGFISDTQSDISHLSDLTSSDSETSSDNEDEDKFRHEIPISVKNGLSRNFSTEFLFLK